MAAAGHAWRVMAARLARVHRWHALPHGGSGTLRTAAMAPRLTQWMAKQHLARHATPGRGGTRCTAAHASHGAGPRVQSKRKSATMIKHTHIYNRIRD